MPRSATAPDPGLFTTQSVPVPLAGVSIEAEITTLCARVAVTQRYVNRESTPIEATYVFPLDEGAAVCGFEAIIDGTLVVGEVKERDEAFRLYDDAIERGDGAFLLDEERPDVFQASIGNLPPGKEVLVKLTYVTELSCSDTGLRFTIPTTVSPRYAPAEDRAGVGRPDAEALNPPRAWHVPYGLQLSVTLTMSGTISRIESPSHLISVTMNGRDATVGLSTRDAALDRDFVLSIEAEGLDAPVARIERDDAGAGAIAVAFVPKLSSGSTPGDITFVVDRSGSMEGSSIEEVRNALQLCLRSMIPGCRFNIVGFGDRFESLFHESRSYDEASLAEASKYVAALDADLGGTEILPALQFVLEQREDRSLPRHIVVLTDGEVTNTDAVLSLAKSHAARARIFTFGIGAGASHHLVNGLARAGGGTAEFIFPGERIEPKVVRQFGRLLSPALTNVRIDWGGSNVTAATSSLPPVFSGDRLLAYALVSGGTASIVRLSADSPAGPLSLEAAIDSSRATRGHTVGTLAARARIRELEESPEWLSLRGSRQTQRKSSRVREEIVALAVKYGLVSRETSFVALERRETPVLGGVTLRRVPIAVTTGWGGVRASESSCTEAVIAQRISLEDTDEMLCALERRMPQSVRELPTSSIGRILVRSPRGHCGGARSARRRGGAAADARPCRSATRRRVVGPDARAGRCHRAGPGRARGCAPRCDGGRGPEGVGNSARDRLAGDSRAAGSGGMAFTRRRKPGKWLDHVQARPPAGGRWIDAAAALLHEATA